MALKDPRERKAYFRDYYQKHKERIRKQNRIHNAIHREEINRKARLYHHAHREECNQRSKANYAAHRQERKTYQRERSQQLKLEVFSHYSGGTPKCAHCGIEDIDILELDHIDNNGAKERRAISTTQGGGYAFYIRLKRNNYPEGYQVLCSNCNLKKEILCRRLK